MMAAPFMHIHRVLGFGALKYHEARTLLDNTLLLAGARAWQPLTAAPRAGLLGTLLLLAGQARTSRAACSRGCM